MENYIYDDKIKDVVKSEEQVDLFGIRGVTKIVDYQEEGLLLELNDYLARSPLDTTAYGNMFGTYTIDDRYYGLPTRCTCWVLYYNKDLFDEAGIASESRHPEEAFEFLSWLCGEGGAQIIAGSGNISGYMNDEIQEIYRDSLQGKNADVFFKSQRVLESPPRPEYNEMLGAFTDIAEEYLLQNITFEEAEAKLEAKRQELYAR